MLLLALLLTGPVQPIVSAEWLLAHRADPDLVVIHAGRNRASYDTVHVAGARYLDWSEFTVTRNGIAVELPEPDSVAAALGRLGVGDGNRVVIYGDVLVAARLWFTLDWLGAGDRAFVLDGGLDRWRGLGYPAGADRPPPARPARLTPQLATGALVDADWVRTRLGSATALVDARNGEEFRGDKLEDGVPRAGHIPGAHNLDWTATIQDVRYLPLDRVKTLFAQAGIPATGELVAYCRTGTRSSVLYLLARSLGYQARMYDGSMVDWARRTELPMATGIP